VSGSYADGVSSEQRTQQAEATLLARRKLVLTSCGILLAAAAPTSIDTTSSNGTALAVCVEMAALNDKGYCKPQTIYPDYVLTESGLQYKDLRIGAGEKPVKGDRVVIDWDGTVM
jgi:hypothetical protein